MAVENSTKTLVIISATLRDVIFQKAVIKLPHNSWPVTIGGLLSSLILHDLFLQNIKENFLTFDIPFTTSKETFFWNYSEKHYKYKIKFTSVLQHIIQQKYNIWLKHGLSWAKLTPSIGNDRLVYVLSLSRSLPCDRTIASSKTSSRDSAI
jgi:hypothetical protein